MASRDLRWIVLSVRRLRADAHADLPRQLTANLLGRTPLLLSDPLCDLNETRSRQMEDGEGQDIGALYISRQLSARGLARRDHGFNSYNGYPSTIENVLNR